MKPARLIADPPPIVSKKNHFESVGTMVDRTMGYIPKALRNQEIRHVLLEHSKDMVRWMETNFATAAARGIAQAAHLLRDPDYYANLKERRRRDKERYDESIRRQDQDRLERQFCPTAEQIEDERERLTRYIAEHEEQIRRWRERLGDLPINAKHFRMPGPKA